MFDNLKVDTQDFSLRFDYKQRHCLVTVDTEEVVRLTSWTDKYEDTYKVDFQINYILHSEIVSRFTDNIVCFEDVKLLLGHTKKHLDKYIGE